MKFDVRGVRVPIEAVFTMVSMREHLVAYRAAHKSLRDTYGIDYGLCDLEDGQWHKTPADDDIRECRRQAGE